jgi:hypothetical protein
LTPETLVAVEPFHGVLHRPRRKLARDDAAGLFAGDQPRVGEHVEVFHHCRQRHRKRPRQFADGNAVALRETGEQRAPRRIGKRVEGAVESGI